MTREDFEKDIMYALGGGLVDVEFECEQAGIDFDGAGSLDYAFRRAKKQYQQKGNDNWRREFLSLPVEKGVATYSLPDGSTDELAKLHTIVKIVKPSTGWNVEDPFSVMAYNDLFAFTNGYGLNNGSSSARMDYLAYELTLQTLERSRRYGAYDAQWTHDKFRNTITFLKTPQRSEVWFLECYRELSDDEYRDVLWVQEWALAEAKSMLGIAYRKFSSLAGPTGDISLSGDQLIQEATQEKERLFEEINMMTDGAEDYVEITFG